VSLQPVGQENAAYFILIGHSRGKLDRFTAYSILIATQFRWNEVRRDEMSDIVIIMIIIIIIIKNVRYYSDTIMKTLQGHFTWSHERLFSLCY